MIVRVVPPSTPIEETSVPGENLTRVEAQERAALVTRPIYDVALDLTTGAETFRSTTVVRVRRDGRARRPSSTLITPHGARGHAQRRARSTPPR